MNNLLTKKFPITALILLCVLTLSCSKERSVELPEKPDGTDVVDWQDSTINGDAVMSQMAFTIGSNMVVKQQATTRTTTNYDGTCTFSENDLIAVAVRGCIACLQFFCIILLITYLYYVMLCKDIQCSHMHALATYAISIPIY